MSRWQTEYPELVQFFGCCFPQYWEELYFPEQTEVTFEDSIRLYAKNLSQDKRQKIIRELERLARLGLGKRGLERVINGEFGSSLYVPALGMTYQNWLERVIEILKEKQTR